jgi:hypothetical protein
MGKEMRWRIEERLAKGDKEEKKKDVREGSLTIVVS